MDWKQANLGQKKNSIKKQFEFCFHCGKYFNSEDDKQIQRINLKKGITLNNIVVICKDCQKELKQKDEYIFSHDTDKLILETYFLNHSYEYRKMIMNSLKYQRKLSKEENSE